MSNKPDITFADTTEMGSMFSTKTLADVSTPQAPPEIYWEQFNRAVNTLMYQWGVVTSRELAQFKPWMTHDTRSYRRRARGGRK